jgi:hypothetical protein
MSIALGFGNGDENIARPNEPPVARAACRAKLAWNAGTSLFGE